MDKAIVFIGKEMEPGGTVPQESEAGEAGNVDEVSGFSSCGLSANKKCSQLTRKYGSIRLHSPVKA